MSAFDYRMVTDGWHQPDPDSWSPCVPAWTSWCLPHTCLSCKHRMKTLLVSSQNSCGYGSIPINTIFNGMNIHLPCYFDVHQGYMVLTHCHVLLDVHPKKKHGMCGWPSRGCSPQKMSKSVAGNPLSHVWIQPKDPKGRSQSVYVRRLPSQWHGK